MSSRNNDSGDARDRMLGSVPGVAALGRGPAPEGGFSRHEYHHPAVGWGAARSVGDVLEKAGMPVEGVRAIFVMNHEDGGFDCPGCAWPDDPTGLRLDLCENGVKHTTWELTRKQVGADFFAAHTVSELAGWSDYDLEDAGRLAEPVRYDAASDRYVPVSWEEAFELAGSTLRGLASPHQAAFYTSGRLSNEATFLYQLWVREFGTNNLPDCSNMCHEASGVAMTAALGTGKGTVDLGDWEQADAIWLMGDNAATNAPRMLTWLAEADRRGAALVHINPLIEAASRRTIVPHEFADMATFHATKIGTMTVQVRIGGDMALLRGVAKAVFEAAATDPGVLDGQFLERYTRGGEEYRALCQATPWSELVQGSGVEEAAIRRLADSYLRSGRVIIAWCLGVTQHEHGVDTVRDTVAQVLDGFEDFNARVRHPHGFRISQPARERGFLTPSGRAEFGLGPLPGDVDPGEGRLMLATIRSHDQFNTTIYSNDDRYRGLKGLRTVVFMNSEDMRERGLEEFDLVDVTSISKDGSRRTVYGYRAVRYEIPRGCAAGYMPELNVLCGIADYSAQSGQPVTKHLEVEVTPSHQNGR